MNCQKLFDSSILLKHSYFMSYKNNRKDESNFNVRVFNLLWKVNYV